jgi:hypothetical protein
MVSVSRIILLQSSRPWRERRGTRLPRGPPKWEIRSWLGLRKNRVQMPSP